MEYKTWGDFNALREAAKIAYSRGPRDCALQKYKHKEDIPEFQVEGKIVAYASPDSTYSLTKKIFEEAQSSILIGIYDFTATYIRDLLIAAADRGVEISLMLDINTQTEKDIIKALEDSGVETVEAPSCLNDYVKYFPSCHEKVIVIDKRLTFVQSGNYTNGSIPKDGKKGHRDMGILIEDTALAEFFTDILKGDMALEPATRAILEKIFPSMIAENITFKIPNPETPPKLFPFKEFNQQEPVRIQPVLSPDNYMEKITALLSSAKKSIIIEQQYIWTNNSEIKKLLQAIKIAKATDSENFKVQIILAPPFVSTPEAWRELEEDINVLVGIGCEVRLLTKTYFSHCHNKLIIVDDEVVLISSQNWSNKAVSQNREAGVIIYNEDITAYFRNIFDEDWRVSEEDRNNEKMNIKASLVAENVMTRIADFKNLMEVDLSDIEQF